MAGWSAANRTVPAPPATCYATCSTPDASATATKSIQASTWLSSISHYLPAASKRWSATASGVCCAMHAALDQLGASVTIGTDMVTIDLGAAALLAMIGADTSQLAADQRISLTLPALL